ncbi:MAG: efflux RND transporter permease subunit [Candidatus Xenobiia bacterium LiM19]
MSRALSISEFSVKHIRHVRSTSRENLSIVMVEFDWGINMDYAAQEIRDKVDPVIEKLPDDARRQVLILPQFNGSSFCGS